MASVVQFVNAITASPTVRLDLNSAASNLMIGKGGVDISPPNLIYAIASTMLSDGQHIAASSYQNRTLKLPIRLVYSGSTDAAATTIQSLGRELNRPMNILKLQLHGATSPVFFRTFRSSYALSMLDLLLTANTEITLELPTEYAGYGLPETPVSGVTVSSDPAAGSNGCFVDVTGVKGDVESPALIRWPVAGTGSTSLYAVRRRGAPSSAPFLFQAEALTQGTDTTTQTNDANFSGAGNNYSRCTFTTATMVTRLSTDDIGTASVDLRGTYRVIARYRKNTSGDGINLRLQWGSTSASATLVTNDSYATANTTSIVTADLGLISIPLGIDPGIDSTGAELSVSDSFRLRLQAERTSGSGTIDIDFLLLIPADDRLAFVQWQANDGDHYLLNAGDTSAHIRNASGQVVSGRAPSITSGLPMLSPNQTNRIYMIRNASPSFAWSLSSLSDVYVSYHPRYLSVRGST